MKYVVYELSDPADSDIPKLVAWGPCPSPWTALWRREMGVEPRVAAWFKSLRERACEPVVKRLLRFGGMGDAERIARLRIDQICQMAGTAPSLPTWLLNERPSTKRRGVVRQLPSGEIERYGSLVTASEATGHDRDIISQWCRGGCKGADGSGWFFDYSE